jgi:hypothetical protein
VDGLWEHGAREAEEKESSMILKSEQSLTMEQGSGLVRRVVIQRRTEWAWTNASAPRTRDREDGNANVAERRSTELLGSDHIVERERRSTKMGQRGQRERARGVVDGRGRGQAAVWRKPIGPRPRVAR